MRTLRHTLLAAALLAAAPLAAQNDRGFEIAKNLEIFSSVYKQLNQSYVDDVDPGKTIKVAELSFEGLEMVTSPSVVVCQVKMTRSAMSAAAKAE